jgi:hypothetical protein
VTLEALAPWKPADDVVLRSAMDHRFREAGARFDRRGAWLVATSVPSEEAHVQRVAFADASHLTKLEVRGGVTPAERHDRHVVTVAPGRWIVLCAPEVQAVVAADLGPGRDLLADMTGAWSVLLLAGPETDRLLRRLGPVVDIPGGGPIAGVPGRVFRRAGLLWVLVAVEYAQHVYDVCADLCVPLGGGPAGLDIVARGAADPLLGPLAAAAAR